MSLTQLDKPPKLIARQVPELGEADRAEERERRARRWQFEYHGSILAGCTLILLGALLLHVRGRHDVMVPIVNQPLPGVCTFRRLTGYDCPGCGLTRSVISVAHGHWWHALLFNPAGPLFFAIIAFQIPYRLVQLVRIQRGRPVYQLGRIDQWIVLVLVVVLLAQWIVKIAFQLSSG